MKKIILISLLLILLVAGGLFAYVTQMDWNVHKEKLSAQLSGFVGEKIQFSGDLKVDVFPHPQLSATDVAVINPQSNKKLANIKDLKMQISLPSLLKGRLDVQNLSLEEVEVWFKFNEDGISNWHQKNKNASLANSNGFYIHNFDIKKSQIHIKHQKYGLELALTDFNANVQAGSVEGPYRLEGSFFKNDNRYGIAVNVDALSQIDDVGMSVVITHPDSESNIRYDGNYNAAADGLKGVFTWQSQKTADWVNALLNKNVIKEEYNKPLMFSTDIQSDETVTHLSDFVIKYNNLFEGSGKVDIYAPQKDQKRKADIKYQLVNFNLSAFENLLAKTFEKYQKTEKYEPDTNFDIAYDISAERVKVSDEATGVLENVSAKGEWKDNVFTLDDFYAACPGNIVLNLKANLFEKDSAPRYYLGIDISGQNLLSFINAFGYKLKSPQQSSYREIDITADLQGTLQVIESAKIDVKMDKADIKIVSSIDMLEKKYVADINADIFNLDNYIAAPETTENTNIAEQIVNESKRFEWLKNNKADINLKAQSATFKGVTARNVDLSVASDGAGLVVVEKAAAANMLGSDVEISGIIKNFGEDNPELQNVTFTIISSDILMLAEKWRVPLPKWPLFEHEKLTQTGAFSGDLQKIYINSLTKSGKHNFRYDGTLSNESNKFLFDGEAALKTENTKDLLQLLVGKLNGKVYSGPMVAKASIKGNSQDWNASEAEIQLGLDKYNASINVKENKKIYKVSGDVQTTNFNLQNWINVQKTKTIPKFGGADENTFIAKPDFSGDVINYNSYRGLAVDVKLAAQKSSYGDYLMKNLKTQIVNEEGTLSFKDLSFENKNHKVSGMLEINYSQTPVMRGNLQIIYPKINNLGGSVYALNADEVEINTEFETSAATIGDMINNLKGKAGISVKSADVKGLNLNAIGNDLQTREYSKGLYQLVRDNVQSGNTAFEAFKVETMLSGGAAALSPSVLKSGNTTVNLSGNINLKEWILNNTLSVKYADLPDVPEYYISFSGMINKPTVDINVEEIAKKYDQHWQKIEDEKARQEQEIKQKQKEKINELQEKITEVSESATAVLSELEELMKKHLTEEAAAKYQTKLNELTEIGNRLQFIKNKTADNINEDEIMQYFNETENSKAQIVNSSSEIQSYYTEDVENKKNELISQESEIYGKIAGSYDEFQQMWNDNSELLKKYNALAYIEQNEILKNYNNTVTQKKTSADALHADMENMNNLFSTLENTDKKYETLLNAAKQIAQEENIISQIQTLQKKALEELLPIVKEQGAVFAEKQRLAEEERRKQAEIDAQNLLLNTDKNPANSEIIKQPSAANENSEINEPADADSQKAGDLSEKPQIISGGKIITQYDKTQKEKTPSAQAGSGILSPASGAVRKVSGTIKVK